MNKLKFLLPLCVVFLAVPIIRCSKECHTDKQVQDASADKQIITISQAKEFLENYCSHILTTKTTDQDTPDENGYLPFVPGDYTFDWDKATQANEAGFGCVDIPISTKNRYIAMSYYTNNNDSIVFYAVRIPQKMIVVKKGDSETICKYMLSLIPDIEYSEGRICSEVLGNFMNIGNKGDYSGLAIYTVPETGELVRVSQFENGEYCNGFCVFDSSVDTLTDKHLISSFMEDISIYRVSNAINTKAYDDEEEIIFQLPGIVVTPKDNKKHSITYLLAASVCMGLRAGGGNSNKIDPFFGRKAMIDIGIPVHKKRIITPNSTRIFRNNTLTEKQWEILENKINEILKDCMGANLYNKLAGLLEGKKIVIKFDDGATGNYFFDGKSSILTINPNKGSDYLFHEMFHIYQAYGEVYGTYMSAHLNMEFEAYLAQFRYLAKTPGFYESKYYKEYVKHPMGDSIASLSNYLDEYGYLKSGKNAVKYKKHISSTMVDAFRNHSRGVYNEKDYPFDESRVGGMNLKNFRAVTEGC